MVASGSPNGSRHPMTARTRLLLAIDDGALRALLAEQLHLDPEIEAVEAADSAAAEAALAQGPVGAILLDARLADADGREVCRALRRRGVACPILLIVPAAELADAPEDGGCGASELVGKPVRLGPLLARLRLLQRQAEADGEAPPLGPYRFLPEAKLLHDPASDREVRLTEKEVAILRHLQRAGGRPVGREELLGEVWGYSAGVTTHTLETHIYRLRRKIEDDPGAARLLLTDAGGYRLGPATDGRG